VTEAILSNALSLQPGAARSRLAVEQAIAALRVGDAIDAENILRRHLLEQPHDAEALARLAGIAIEQRRMDEATVLLRRAAGAEPSADRRMALVNHLQACGGPALALAEIEALPPSARSGFDVRLTEAALLGMVGDHERQIALYERLTAEFPSNAPLWMGIGNALRTVGRIDQAVAALRRAIALAPSCGEAYWTLANFKSFRFTDRDVSAMRKALRGKLGDGDRLHFDFALGKAFEDRADFVRSFEYYAAGNRLRSAGVRAEEMRVTPFVDRAIATLDRALFERHSGAGCPARDPIFVLGLHRSGSSLIEQILASHPLIEGAGELPVMQQIWERIAQSAVQSGRDPFTALADSESAVFADIGAEYLDRTRAFRLSGRPLFVDKLPANWLNVGLIRLALPNAKIIDARRHPMACGFSNFKQHYAVGVRFAYSLPSIGWFYGDYLRLMRHFDAVQPGAIHHAVNERLIENPEGEVRRLLAFAGVPFDPACLDFHRNPRAVATPSAEQVRRPLNRDGVDAWRPFEPWLGPLKDALGTALDDWLPAPA
jgi:tetratricopeptide (TPR) repeat protein